MVALLAEGVDRNPFGEDGDVAHHTSPSSRRAWIEIKTCDEFVHVVVVALLAEGVDRNEKKLLQMTSKWRSPSSRRAWIEILL